MQSGLGSGVEAVAEAVWQAVWEASWVAVGEAAARGPISIKGIQFTVAGNVPFAPWFP